MILEATGPLFVPNPTPTACERCQSEEGVKAIPAMTAYHPTPLSRWKRLMLDNPLDPPDPNADVYLCPDCAQDHVEYWTEMWDEYNRGRL